MDNSIWPPARAQSGAPQVGQSRRRWTWRGPLCARRGPSRFRAAKEAEQIGRLGSGQPVRWLAGRVPKRRPVHLGGLADVAAAAAAASGAGAAEGGT